VEVGDGAGDVGFENHNKPADRMQKGQRQSHPNASVD
jgi:hypothetical protein